MSEIIALSVDEVTPDRDAVFKNQGLPAGQTVTDDTEALYAEALELFSRTATPQGVLGRISKSDFAVVHEGEGRNERRTPVADIYPQADHLALYVVTLGKRITEEIAQRFGSNDFALGCMLDSVASAAADKAAQMAEMHFLEILRERDGITSTTVVLGYSPGYCGWDISGQRKLFDFLGPERIGVSLRDSFLMEPLKSVSGVLIAGPRKIHSFPDSYPACEHCEAPSCHDRMRALHERFGTE